MGIHRQRSERGAAAVEFALVMPILFLLVFGIIEFGFIFNKMLSVTHSAREGVRTYALTGSPTPAQSFAQAASGLNPAPTCLASPSSGVPTPGAEVAMTCTTTYQLHLYIIHNNLTLSSTAKARKE
ncbi:MAG: pilus assembly protein [Actinomycetota bacterium]|nr:pilus assembly protein [Actinomycetota bacterium]